MKVVAHCGLTRSAGGLYYAVSSLAQALSAKGVDLSVFGRESAHLDEDLAAWSPAEIFAYKAYGPLGSSKALRAKLALTSPALIHQHGLWQDDQWAAFQWQQKRGCPVVVSPHGMLDPWAVENAAWKKKLVGRLFADKALQHATCIHALCRSEAEAIRGYGLTNPIAIIPNGINLPDIEVAKPVNSPKKTVLFLGRIHPKKGLKELVQGWAKANAEDPSLFAEWELQIAGWDDGRHLEGLKQEASRCGMLWSDASEEEIGRSSSEVNICFLGPRFGEEKSQLLRGADAFILPSFSEGLPMSILEAWSFGVPVLMSEFCNLPEGFEAGAALQVEPNPRSLEAMLRSLVGMDDVARREMGANGRLLVERHFTWEFIAERMKSVYDWCLGGEKPDFVED